MPKRRIAVVSGTRADYGLLYWLMKLIQDDPELELRLIVTGMHLSPEFGLTYQVIEEDGFNISEKVEMLLSSDTSVGITKSVGLATIGFADTLDRLKPDILVLLGDRYEVLAAAQAALIARIPIAHIGGGDTTEGAYDEAIRHSVTKMSHMHFVTNVQAAERVRQLGENPEQIYVVGSPGLDQIKRLTLLERNELEVALGFEFRRRNLLVTFHPATLETQDPAVQFQELLAALDALGGDVGILFTKPNSDSHGRAIIQMIDAYVADRPHAKAFTSLGQLRYLSAMAQVDAVVGNSSSGLYEVPSFKKPTINIGDRQKGRLRAESILDCEPKKEAIIHALQLAFEVDCSEVVNPYGDGESSARIWSQLRACKDPQALLKKRFFDRVIVNV